MDPNFSKHVNSYGYGKLSLEQISRESSLRVYLVAIRPFEIVHEWSECTRNSELFGNIQHNWEVTIPI